MHEQRAWLVLRERLDLTSVLQQGGLTGNVVVRPTVELELLQDLRHQTASKGLTIATSTSNTVLYNSNAKFLAFLTHFPIFLTPNYQVITNQSKFR